MATPESPCYVCAVQFTCVPGAKTNTNNLPLPAHALVKWSNGTEDCVDLQHKGSGAARDVFSAQHTYSGDGAVYVLKLTGMDWHERSNVAEANLGISPTGLRTRLHNLRIYAGVSLGGRACTTYYGILL